MSKFSALDRKAHLRCKEANRSKTEFATVQEASGLSLRCKVSELVGGRFHFPLSDGELERRHYVSSP